MKVNEYHSCYALVVLIHFHQIRALFFINSSRNNCPHFSPLLIIISPHPTYPNVDKSPPYPTLRLTSPHPTLPKRWQVPTLPYPNVDKSPPYPTLTLTSPHPTLPNIDKSPPYPT